MDNHIRRIAIVGHVLHGGRFSILNEAISEILDIHKNEQIEIFVDSYGGNIPPRIDELKLEAKRLLPCLPYCPPLSRRERRKLARKNKK